MSNSTQWKTINNGNKKKDDFKECSLQDLMTDGKACYYCVMNKCKDKEHDRYDQNLKRLKYSFKDILYNPLNYSDEFKRAFMGETKRYMKKKYNITTNNYYVTNCTTTFLGRNCFNVKDGFHYDFQFKGETFKACHKNPDGSRGKIMICLHFDLHKRNNKVSIHPAKDIENVKQHNNKTKPNFKPKKEEFVEKEKVEEEMVKKDEKPKEKDMSLWSNSLFIPEKKEEEKETIKDFKVKIEKKKPKKNNEWSVSLMDKQKIDKENETKELIAKLEDENIKLKEFISNAYDKRISDIVSKQDDENNKMELIDVKKQEPNSNLIKLWKKGFEKNY